MFPEGVSLMVGGYSPADESDDAGSRGGGDLRAPGRWSARISRLSGRRDAEGLEALDQLTGAAQGQEVATFDLVGLDR
jgi:hypothetical protein